MRLKSGYEVHDFEKDEEEKQKKLFDGYSNGLIRLQPGNWFFTKPFLKYADRLYDFEFHPSDTLIMTFPKCGTTWMQEIIWNMKHPSNLGDPIQGVSVNTRCTFLEADFLMDTPNVPPPSPDSDILRYFDEYCPGLDAKDGAFIQLAHHLPAPRIFKTHLPFSFFKPGLLDTCKVVFVVRNPKDVCVSFFHHSRMIKAHGYQGGLEDFFDLFIGDKVLYGPYWTFLREAWTNRDHPNFHLVHFEHLKADPATHISGLNKFLDTRLSDELIPRVVEETTFKKMKERDSFTGGLKEKSSFVDSEKGSFFRSGTAGSWKKELSEEQNNRMDAWTKKNTENGQNFLPIY